MVRGSNPAIQYMAAWMATVSLVFERRSAGFWERNGTNLMVPPHGHLLDHLAAINRYFLDLGMVCQKSLGLNQGVLQGYKRSGI